LFVAREIGALIRASVNKLPLCPNLIGQDRMLVSVCDSVPVKINDTTSACGNDGSAPTLVSDAQRPSIIAVTR